MYVLLSCTFLLGSLPANKIVQYETAKTRSYEQCYTEAVSERRPLLVWHQYVDTGMYVNLLESTNAVHCFNPPKNSFFKETGVYVSLPTNDPKLKLKYICTTKSFNQIINIVAPSYTVYNFGNEDCIRCKLFEKQWQQLITSNPKVHFLKIDTNEDTEAVRIYNVTSYPTIIILNNGVEIHRSSGTPSSGIIQTYIRPH